jgi:recombination protein RecA
MWDSIAATPTRAELKEGLIGGEAMGYRARTLSRALRSLTALAARKQTAILLVNQTRTKIGVMFGDPITTPGGDAVKFAASVRLRLYAGKAVKDAATHIGREITVKAAKNKLAPPFRKALVRFDFARGWDDDWSTLNYAKELGLVPERARGEKSLAEARAALDGCGWLPERASRAGAPETKEEG